MLKTITKLLTFDKLVTISNEIICRGSLTEDLFLTKIKTEDKEESITLDNAHNDRILLSTII